MQKIIFSILLMGIGYDTSITHAAPPNMQPGLWEISTATEMQGMPMKMPPTTVKHCFSKNDLADTNKVLPKDKKCEITNQKTEGNQSSWNMQCKGEPAMSGSGTVTFNGDSYAGSMKMNIKNAGETMQIMHKYQAKRIGNCTK